MKYILHCAIVRVRGYANFLSIFEACAYVRVWMQLHTFPTKKKKNKKKKQTNSTNHQ